MDTCLINECVRQSVVTGRVLIKRTPTLSQTLHLPSTGSVTPWGYIAQNSKLILQAFSSLALDLLSVSSVKSLPDL